MTGLLEKKVVVITGGAGLLGSAFVEAIMAENGIAVIADCNEAAGQALAGNLRQRYNPDTVQFELVDIAQTDSIIGLIDRLHRRYGRIDGVVNNAYPRNANYGRHFFEIEYEDFCENLSLNVGGYFLVAQQFARYFSHQGHGNIINIASIYGVVSPRFEIYEDTSMTMPVEYAAIKSAVIHLSKYMAQLFKPMNIRVNAISPGGIRDRQPDVFQQAYGKHCGKKGMLDANDLAGSLLFLLSDESRYMTGQNLVIDDGFTL